MQIMQIPQIAPEADKKVLETGPRVALLTSYNGGNLGDAAIQDAMISNLRLRIPRVQFFGITLNCDNFVKQHGAGAFPLLSAMLPPSYGSRESFDPLSHTPEVHRPQPAVWRSSIRNALRSIPGLLPLVKKARARWPQSAREILHSLEGYRVLRHRISCFFPAAVNWMTNTEGLEATICALQMGSAGSLGSGALRHGQRWGEQDVVADFAPVRLARTPFVLLPIFSGEK